MEMLEGARSPWPSATGYQEEAQPTSSGSQPSRDGSRSTNQLESHPHGSIDTDMQKVLDRAKNMSEKNRKVSAAETGCFTRVWWSLCLLHACAAQQPLLLCRLRSGIETDKG